MRRAGLSGGTGAWLRAARLAPLLGVLAIASSARALDVEQVRALLRVEPGATCLTADRLAVEIIPLLEDARLPNDLLFVVEGSASDPRSARLRVVRERRTVAERAFEPGPDRCSHLHAAVGLAIALALNARDEESAREPARPWSLSVAGLWTYRLLPQLAPGAQALVRRAFGEHALLRAGAAGAFAFEETLGSQGTFDASLFVARLDGCGRARLSTSLRADGCAGLLGGVLYASGSEVASPDSSAVPWLALVAAAELELELSQRWALALGFSAHFLLHRVEVGLEDASGRRAQTHPLNRVGLALGIGPVYYF